MRKRIAVIVAFVVVVFGAFALTACKGGKGGGNGTPAEHVHVADSYEITVEATCTEDGEREGVCTVCGETFSETIAARGHDWHLQYEEGATCTLDGKQVYACANCFAFDERSVAALGHDDGIVVPAIPAGCETVGWTEGKNCARCGEALVVPEEVPAAGHEYYYEKRGNDSHAIYCEKCNYSEIAECEFVEIEIAPTCTESGRLLHTCKDCGDNHEHITTEALGHLWTGNWAFYRTVDGVYKHRKTCYRCEAYDEEDCSNEAGKTVLPECETIGYTVYSCVECLNTFNSDFREALGHDWSEYELDDDSADPYSHTHKRNCKRDNCTAKEIGVPVGTVGAVLSVRIDETCTTDAFTCYSCSLDACSYTRKDTYANTALGHSFGAWEYSGDNDEHHTHTHTCLRTDCSAAETADCRMTTSSQAATCTKPEIEVDVCQDCFHVDRDESPALGHKFGDWIYIRYTTGELMHTHVCTVCNFREYGVHSFEITTMPADCDHDETTVNTCSVCGYASSTSTPNTALGHDWVYESGDANTHTLVCARNNDHTVTESHNYNESNICRYDGVDGLTYELSIGGDYYIVKNDNGLGRASEINVPAFRAAQNSAEMLPVRAIGKSAFFANTYITKVSLPATVTAIEEAAFGNCASLVSVEFYGGDSQLTRIEYHAFNNCAKLENIELSENLMYIGVLAFNGCASLNTINVPQSVKEIGISAFANSGFYNNSANWTDGALYAGKVLIKVDDARIIAGQADGYKYAFTIKDGTIAVSEYAFDKCVNMEKVSIPASVKAIGGGAFSGCTNLVAVEYGGDINGWFGITFGNNLSSPMYYAKRMSILGEESAEPVLPENITSIPAGTFKGNTAITTLRIPAKVTSIGDEAFMGCVNLTRVIFDDDNVISMGKDVFTGTAFYLDAGNWQGGVLKISKHIIATNADFVAVDGAYVIDNDVVTIAPSAFAERNITNIIIGSNVKYIGAKAFKTGTLVSATFVNTVGSWFAKNDGGIVRLVSVTADGTANARLLNEYQGEWRKA